MKYVIPVILLVAVCCTGCFEGRYRWPGIFPKAYHRTEPPRRDIADDAQPVPTDVAQAPDDQPPAPPDTAPAPGDEEPPVIDRPDAPPLPGPDAPVIERHRRLIEVRPSPFKVKEREVMPGRFYAGLSIGNVYGNKGNAVHDLDDTDFENGMLTGLHVGYMPEMRKTNLSPHFATRYGVEFRLQDYSLMLDDDGLDIGKLNMTSAVFAFKFFQTPERDNIFGFHGDLGLGWGWTWFEKDDMLKQDDIINSRRTSISVDMAMIFAFSVGVDLKIAPDACVSLDFRYEDVDVPARWSENAVYRRDVDRFDASSGQLILSFRWFF